LINLKIEDLLYNVNQSTIEAIFLSTIVLKTLQQYDEDLLKPSKIRELVSTKISHAEMLRDKKMRNVLTQSIQQKSDVNRLADILGIKKDGDVRKNLLNARITKNSSREKKLFKFFEIEDIPIEDNILNVPQQEIISTKRPLFPHQRNAVDQIQEYLNEDKHAALLHMPTGSGKTRTTMRVISNIFMNNRNTLVIWVALTEELCEQAVDEFRNTWRDVGDREVTVFRFFGKHSPKILNETKKNCEGFIVAGMSKLNSVKDDLFLTTLADRVKLVVMDEAHHVIAPTYKSTIELLSKKHRETKLLGLSATPGRTLEETEENYQLADFFGTNKVMLRINNQNPIRFLIDNQYIAKPDIKIINHRDQLTDDDKSIISSKLEIPHSVLEKLGGDIIRNIKIISEVEELVNNGQNRIIIFTPSIKSSRDIAMILSAKKFNAYYIDSNLSEQLRKQVINEYKRDSDKEIILCNVNILTAGFDAPKTSAVIIARPTKSLVMYSQMIGRAIRGRKVGGNKKCFIRVITDESITEFRDIVSAFEHWEREWQ